MQNSKSQFKIKKFLIIFLIIWNLLPLFSVKAAKLYFEPNSLEIKQDQFVLINFFIDTEQEEINALEGIIKIPEGLLEIQGVSDGSTIISLWAERPIFNEDKNEIRFSGIIPGGYTEQNGFLFSFKGFSRKLGQGDIEIQQARVLLNDGQGTVTQTIVAPLEVIVSDKAIPFSIETKKDTEPPEVFIPELANDPIVFGGKWFIAFATQDKSSGIAYYQIYESNCKIEISKIEKNKWITVISPYILKDQDLRSYIYIKAVDNEGNERIVVTEPRNPIKWYELWENWVIILIVIMFLILRKTRILNKKN